MAPKRIPRYAARGGRLVLTATDKVFNTALGRLGAYVLIVAVAVVAFTALARQQRDSCEAGNRFRSEDLPAAFARHDRDLGVALGADAAEIEAFIRESEPNLREALPLRDC